MAVVFLVAVGSTQCIGESFSGYAFSFGWMTIKSQGLGPIQTKPASVYNRGGPSFCLHLYALASARRFNTKSRSKTERNHPALGPLSLPKNTR